MSSESEIFESVIKDIDAIYSGKRTNDLIFEYCKAMYGKVSVELLRQVKSYLVYNQPYKWWPSVDQLLSIADKIKEESKTKEKRKVDMVTGEIFDFDRLPEERKTEIAKFCCNLVKKYLYAPKELAEKMIEGEKEIPGAGLKQAGASLLNHLQSRKVRL